jgi:hypothetical protein
MMATISRPCSRRPVSGFSPPGPAAGPSEGGVMRQVCALASPASSEEIQAIITIFRPALVKKKVWRMRRLAGHRGGYPFARGSLRSKPILKTDFLFASSTVIDQAERSCTRGWHNATLSSRTCLVALTRAAANPLNIKARTVGELALPIRKMEIKTRHAASPTKATSTGIPAPSKLQCWADN